MKNEKEKALMAKNLLKKYDTKLYYRYENWLNKIISNDTNFKRKHKLVLDGIIKKYSNVAKE